ncbi:tyrosine-type recombinase/integrase [Clostridioides sp. ES-S-0108-01]|uniref:tyrosine-type recombinase/integrase n=1 Tax=Clostridioides sp. ES-S-0108-01 TaxID=2770773 RepID=UPI001D0CA255|nr:tyrosine-type recombinase/integrase [Clostridioides sp. ES-S-0108-01]
MTGIEALEEFLLNLKLYNDRDEKTIKAYRADVKEGIRYLFEKEDCTMEELDKILFTDIQEKWFVLLKEKGMKAATINRKRASFKAYCGFLKAKGKIENNPVSYVKKLQDKVQSEKKILTKDEIIKLLKTVNSIYVDDENYDTCRNSLIINLLISTGMRIHEVEKMNMGDINFSNGDFEVVGKRKLKRNVSLNKQVLKLYVKFLYFRNQIEGKEDSKNSKNALFLSKNKTRLTTRSIERIVKKVLKLAELPHVTPHSFKHNFVSIMCEEGVKLEDIGKFTGNRNIQTMYKHYMHQATENNTKKMTENNPIYFNL